MKANISLVIVLVSLVCYTRAFNWTTSTFRTVPCNATNATTACAGLETEYNEDVCCANITVRSGSSIGQITNTALQCYTRYMATWMGWALGGGHYATYTCINQRNNDIYTNCLSENDCVSTDCCMRTQVTFNIA